MKNSCKIAILLCFAALVGITACNDAKYDKLGTHAFVNESATGKSTKITITEVGADAELTVCLSQAATQNVKFRFVVDSLVLDRYNAKNASSYTVLPADVLDMDQEITINAGDYSAVATKIHIKPLPEHYVGESYALPLRLESIDGLVPVTSTTATYVITTESVFTSSFPMFTGGASLAAAAFPLTLPQFTIECRFQVSNTGNRNRAVFTNGGSVLLRFEDPQSDNATDKKHSMVQFQGDGWYMNPSAGLSFKPNVWQHLALTYDGTAVVLYVNGAFAGRKEGTINPLFGGAAWFGGDAGGGHGTGDSWWSGCKILCTEMRIWSVARTAAQIQNNMISTSVKSQNLMGYWRMNEGSGNIFQDLTGNGHTLTTGQDPVWINNIKSNDTETPWP